MLEEWLLTQLERKAALSLQQQLYRALRHAMLAQRIKAGARLPSSRALAQQLKVARNTVLGAYEQLQAEGYLETQRGSGCYVSAQLPDTQTQIKPRSKIPRVAPLAIAPSKRCMKSIEIANCLPPRRSAGAFVPATPDFRSFPIAEWQRLVRQYERRAPWQWLDYSNGAGLAELKLAIAQHLQLARAVNCDPEQVIVTSSTQQSLELCFRILADAQDCIALEDPGYFGAQCTAAACDLQSVPVAVDSEGIVVSKVPDKARLIYVTPSHQYPLGVVMSLARRKALLQHAIQHRAFILEDDYDSELRFNGRPLASLQGLDQHQRVFYLGTFSKVFYPAMRMAYVVVPPGWVKPFTQLHNRLYSHGHLPLQAALAELIRCGKLASHIRKLRVIYNERNRYLQVLLRPLLERGWQLSGDDAGLHFIIIAPKKIDDYGIAMKAWEQGITLRPLSALYLGREKRYGFMLGYAAADKRELKQGVKILLSLI